MTGKPQRPITSQFLRFSAVGATGFVVDESVLALMINLVGLNPFQGRVISILCSMTFTWWGNRTLTFAEHASKGRASMFGEWLRYIAANSVGAVINYTTFAAITGFAPAPFDNPYLATAVGVGVGLMFNFTLSRTLVFRAHRK